MKQLYTNQQPSFRYDGQRQKQQPVIIRSVPNQTSGLSVW
ncbi:hypothetical protein AHF37_05392 [Paragonimus kellicotti]|nr:hypothetical protein AHF37_05392 [Paragonimus kellicotti]